jgi:hypothetical protein
LNPDPAVPNDPYWVRIVESDGNVVELAMMTEAGAITVITEMTRDRDDLILSKLHIDGPGTGSAGIRTLRALARAFGKQQGAARVIVRGGIRTTGARPGREPRPIIVVVEVNDG